MMDHEILYPFMLRIFNCALTPYMEILYTWVFRGELDDPNQEFFIQRQVNRLPLIHKVTCFVSTQHALEKSSDYWTLSFQIRHALSRECCPIFLKKYQAYAITTGKTIHFIRLIHPQDDHVRQNNKK
jgi:hypothetical protein